jgi:hypothetical protein
MHPDSLQYIRINDAYFYIEKTRRPAATRQSSQSPGRKPWEASRDGRADFPASFRRRILSLEGSRKEKVMLQERTYTGMMGSVQRLITALEANGSELPHLEGARQRLANLLVQAQENAKTQAALTASKQETSKQLRTLITESQRVANAVRALLKEHYGLRSEKLAEFGLQPFRGRTRKVKPAAPEPPVPPPTAPPQTQP